MKITDAFVSTVQPTQQLMVYKDDEQPGFRLRVYPAGTKIWYLETRIRGRLYNRKIGSATLYKTREARSLAKQLIGELVQGVDSQSNLKDRDREAKKAASERRHAETIEQASNQYLSTVDLKPATLKYYRKLITRGLNDYGRKILCEVDADFIRRIYEEISARVTPLHATKCVRYIRTLRLWRELDNPVPTRMRMAASKPRQARLEPSDGSRIWAMLQPYLTTSPGAYLALMLLTGCRSSELSNLLVEQVDLSEGYFRLKETKNGRDHKVYLSHAASEIIAPFVKGKEPGEVVFIRSKEGRSVKERLQSQKPWSNHDLRKLFAIVAMEIGVPYPVIKAALNHSTGDVTLTHYAQATPSQLRSCWEKVATFYTGSTWNPSTSTKKPLSEPLSV